jgi:hypothetical protein
MAIESANYQNSEGTRPRSGLFPGHRTDSPLASNLLITCPLDLEAAMARSIRPGVGSCVLCAFCFAALAGCGSSSAVPTPDGLVSTDGSAGAGGSVVANGGGSSGGIVGTGSGGVFTAGACSSAPVTFQVMPALNAATHWCLGQPESCSGWGEIRNSSGTLELRSFCGVSCETCTIEQCPPLACMGPTELTDQGVTWTWEGSYVTSSTCGASATTCDLTNCATPGQYTFNVCGFPNPDPSSADGCYEASGTTNQTCVPVLFEYPAIAPIVVTMPLE